MRGFRILLGILLGRSRLHQTICLADWHPELRHVGWNGDLLLVQTPLERWNCVRSLRGLRHLLLH